MITWNRRQNANPFSSKKNGILIGRQGMKTIRIRLEVKKGSRKADNGKAEAWRRSGVRVPLVVDSHRLCVGWRYARFVPETRVRRGRHVSSPGSQEDGSVVALPPRWGENK